jgi:hypothetical protein
MTNSHQSVVQQQQQQSFFLNLAIVLSRIRSVIPDPILDSIIKFPAGPTLSNSNKSSRFDSKTNKPV